MGVDVRSSAVRVTTDAHEQVFDHLVVCAGLQSSVLARLVGAPSDPEIIPFRGEYYEIAPGALRSHSRSRVSSSRPSISLPRSAFHSRSWRSRPCRPERRPGHVPRGISVGRCTTSRALAHSAGIQECAKWRANIGEWVPGRFLVRMSKSLFFRRARAYVPDLSRADLVRSGAGVRAQALHRDGTLVDDFVIDHQPRVTLVRNAPSPAATASLAIAEHIVGEMADNDVSFARRMR